jgi:maleate cis-trans isomerase
MSDLWAQTVKEIRSVLEESTGDPVSSSTAANAWDLVTQIRSDHMPQLKSVEVIGRPFA